MTPVVLLHALGVDSSMWDDQRRALRERGHPVIAPDQRGFGGVPLGDAPATLDVLVDDLAAVLDSRGAAEVVLAGASMGGYLAAAFLRRHPDRVRGLVLMSTRGSADEPRARTERETFAALVLDDARRPALLAATTPRLLGATSRARRPGVVARLSAMVEAAPPASLAWAQRAVAGRPDAFAALRAADIPALVVAGAEDELVPPAEPRELARALPRGDLLVVPDSGHLPPLETPDTVTAALLGLLGRVGTGAAR